MAFDGNEGSQITLTQGAALTKQYRKENPAPTTTLAHFFGRNILLQLLNQPECMGIRMYYGINSEGKKQLVLVGAKADENDMLELVVDMSVPCPTRCSSTNVLNS